MRHPIRLPENKRIQKSPKPDSFFTAFACSFRRSQLRAVPPCPEADRLLSQAFLFSTQEMFYPIIEWGQGRGGTRCRSTGPSGRRRPGTPNGRTPRCRTNCRPVSHGASRMTVQLDLSHLHHNDLSNLYTTHRHSHAYHKNPSR